MARVCHIITALDTGGAEHQLERIVVNMPGDHRVLSLRGGGCVGPRLEDTGIPVKVLEIDSALGWGIGAIRVRRWLAQSNPDVVQGWMYHANLAALVGALGREVPVFWSVRHSVQDIEEETPRTRRAIRASVHLSGRPNVIVYNSEAAAVQHEALGYPTRKRKVIPNGFDVDTLVRNSARGRELRERLGIPASAAVVGVVARYHPMKDHAGFLRAAARVAHDTHGVHFVLAGRGVDWDNRELVGVIDAAALRGQVHLLGECHDVIALYSALDVLACPSAWGEAFPNVVGEAMSCGIPCVVTDVGDASRVVGDTGLTVPPRDVTAMSDALIDLLRDKDRRDELGAEARRRVESSYDLNTVIRLYEQLWSGGPCSSK